MYQFIMNTYVHTKTISHYPI